MHEMENRVAWVTFLLVVLAQVFQLSKAEIMETRDVHQQGLEAHQQHDSKIPPMLPTAQIEDLRCKALDVRWPHLVQLQRQCSVLFSFLWTTQIQRTNGAHLRETLEHLSNTTYFRLIQIDLGRDCKYWKKNASTSNCTSPTSSIEDALPEPKSRPAVCEEEGKGGNENGSSWLYTLFGSWMPITVSLWRTFEDHVYGPSGFITTDSFRSF